MTDPPSQSFGTAAAVGALLLCAVVAAYCLFLVFVGTTYEVWETSTNGGAANHYYQLVRVPVALVPLALSALVALGVVFRWNLLAWGACAALLAFGFLSGFSIGGPIFLAALLLVGLLLVRRVALVAPSS